MEVFRLARKKYPIELSGKGASEFGARWNSKGTEIIYTAQSRAMAMAEVAVHLSLAMLPKDFVMLTITIPDTVSIAVLDENKLQAGWSIFPNSFPTQIVGDTFIKEATHCILRVPSAVVQGDFSYLINPHHKDFKHIKIIEKVNFPFDIRIFKT